MVIVRPLTEHDAAILCEAAFTEEDWRHRAKLFSMSNSCATFLAFDEIGCCGIVGSLKEPDEPSWIILVSMWVDARARRLGLARGLIAEVERWAIEQNATQIVLDVTEGNQSAIECYKRCGFEFTGETFPHPREKNLRELAMRKLLKQSES